MCRNSDAALASSLDRAARCRAWSTRDVLGSGALVELQVLVDLRLALALGGLVDRELDAPVAVRDHLRHQRRVLGRDRLVGEVDHLGHPEHVLVVGDPLLHVPELDVADDVVDAVEAARPPRACGPRGREAREERAAVVRRARRRCAASRRRSAIVASPHGPVVVLDLVRRRSRPRAPRAVASR